MRKRCNRAQGSLSVLPVNEFNARSLRLLCSNVPAKHTHTYIALNHSIICMCVRHAFRPRNPARLLSKNSVNLAPINEAIFSSITLLPATLYFYSIRDHTRPGRQRADNSKMANCADDSKMAFWLGNGMYVRPAHTHSEKRNYSALLLQTERAIYRWHIGRHPTRHAGRQLICFPLNKWWLVP